MITCLGGWNTHQNWRNLEASKLIHAYTNSAVIVMGVQRLKWSMYQISLWYSGIFIQSFSHSFIHSTSQHVVKISDNVDRILAIWSCANMMLEALSCTTFPQSETVVELQRGQLNPFLFRKCFFCARTCEKRFCKQFEVKKQMRSQLTYQNHSKSIKSYWKERTRHSSLLVCHTLQWSNLPKMMEWSDGIYKFWIVLYNILSIATAASCNFWEDDCNWCFDWNQRI